jgi:predicted TIM-barrel fold metal-dependent hydrolase
MLEILPQHARNLGSVKDKENRKKGDPRTKNLYFDVATVADEQPEEELKRFAARIRQVGLKRVLYGSDLGPPYARQEWLTFRTTVPLTDDEMRTIAGNVAPYF